MPGRPPKSWFDEKSEEVKKGNPDYSEEQVRKTVGNIWYNDLSQYRRNKLTKKYEGAMRVRGERIVGERIYPTQVQAANFPNLFSSDTRKWIELQTRNLAANMGPISSPEQAVSFVNDAAAQVIAQIGEAVDDEVHKIIEEEKDNILKEIVTEDTTFEEELMAPPPAPQIPMEMAEEPAPAPVAAAYIPHKLRIAFEKSANPAEQSMALVKLDPTFLAHLEELEEQAESVERLAEWVKDYIVGRGLIDQEVAEGADWLEPTKLLTSSSRKKKVSQVENDDEEESWEPRELSEDWPYTETKDSWDDIKYVSAYRVDRAYGGPEEGGWWYNWYELLDAIPVRDKKEAQEWRNKLREMHGEGEGDIYSMKGGHEIDILFEDKRGENESTERPYYE